MTISFALNRDDLIVEYFKYLCRHKMVCIIIV